MKVDSILCASRVSQNRSHDPLCLSSRSPLRPLLRKNTHPLDLQTIHLMYRSPGGNRQSLFPYGFSLLHFICRIGSNKEPLTACLMFCYNTIKTIHALVVQMNRWINKTLAYFIWIFQNIYHGRFPVHHIGMFLLNEIMPVLFRCSNFAAQRGDDFKQNGHTLEQYYTQKRKSKLSEDQRSCD